MHYQYSYFSQRPNLNARISAPTPERPLPTGIDLLLSRLNPDQRAAARHGLDGETSGPLLVIAGAGSGKTNTLAHRVGCLIASGVDPRSILLLTFSRRAAAEMSRRVEGIVAALGRLAGRPSLIQHCRGPAPFTASVRACCASSRSDAASTRPSPFSIAKTPPTC